MADRNSRGADHHRPRDAAIQEVVQPVEPLPATVLKANGPLPELVFQGLQLSHGRLGWGAERLPPGLWFGSPIVGDVDLLPGGRKELPGQMQHPQPAQRVE